MFPAIESMTFVLQTLWSVKSKSLFNTKMTLISNAQIVSFKLFNYLTIKVIFKLFYLKISLKVRKSKFIK